MPASDDELDFDQTDRDLEALGKTSAGRQLLDFVESLFTKAVDEGIAQAREHGPELVEALIRGAAEAAIQKGIERLSK